eukprot:TRINITY_DN232479_c0_g1_i1.p1 TRINITY_DN232479_c0_g1~~TRINITY_DN232479_c0_g1_i1.p1  ORF type:complete len:228 (+),score=39.23 TRINITY_DN232479_c0_g1_i1:188-871(+)
MRLSFVLFSVLVTLLTFSTKVYAKDNHKRKCLNQHGIKWENEFPTRKRLDFCQGYHNSCCSAKDSRTILLNTFQFGQKMSDQCAEIHKHLECGVCHPLVGTKELPYLCSHTCFQYYNACKKDFFTYDGTSLRYCNDDAIICSRLEDIIDKGSKEKFCESMGWSVSSENCFSKEMSLADKAPPKIPQKKSMEMSWQLYAGIGLIICSFVLFVLYSSSSTGRKLNEKKY